MKIPSNVQIGGIDYVVCEKVGLNNGQNVCYGHISFQESLIELNSDNQNHQKKCITLWHEIIHGIVEHANIDITDSNEESIVDIIAKGVCQVLQDNANALFDIAKVKVGE